MYKRQVEIDGGKRFAKIRYVTWPFLKPTFAILFIMECGKIMSGGDTFDQVYVFGNTQNRAVADILDTFILRVGLEQGRYSYATAANLFKSVINVILLITANKMCIRDRATVICLSITRWAMEIVSIFKA